MRPRRCLPHQNPSQLGSCPCVDIPFPNPVHRCRCIEVSYSDPTNCFMRKDFHNWRYMHNIRYLTSPCKRTRVLYMEPVEEGIRGRRRGKEGGAMVSTALLPLIQAVFCVCVAESLGDVGYLCSLLLPGCGALCNRIGIEGVRVRA
jgi:hypothetical protein